MCFNTSHHSQSFRTHVVTYQCSSSRLRKYAVTYTVLKSHQIWNFSPTVCLLLKCLVSTQMYRGIIFISQLLLVTFLQLTYLKKLWYAMNNITINSLNTELNPICYLLAILGAHHFFHVSRIRVKLLTFRLLMSYIYGAPILDVSRSHTTTQHSR